MLRASSSLGLLGVAALAILLACGGSESGGGAQAPAAGDPAPVAEAAEATSPSETQPASLASVGGTYAVEGVTVVERTGSERPISGTVIIAQDGNAYTTTFEMKTRFPTEEGATRDADVIGKGDGIITGRNLAGTAETQIVIASVPGVDAQFAFIPRTVTTRIVSTASGEVADDGALIFEIKSSPAEGEVYEATRTTLRGERVVQVDPGPSGEAAP